MLSHFGSLQEGAIAPHFASLHQFAVYVPPLPFVAGKATLAGVLGGISAARVRDMQRELARQAPRLLYPLASTKKKKEEEEEEGEGEEEEEEWPVLREALWYRVA